jgi:periplasmic divalent cation tolerance protein
VNADIVLVLTTVATLEAAETIGRTLVEERLAACVNVLAPMISIYRWHGAVERDEERQLVIKTTRQQAAAVQARVAALHPYELPELLVVPVAGGGDAYLQWVKAETGG